MSRTKIIATLGPASAKPPVIRAMIEARVDVFRLNFSHGTQSTHRKLVQAVRQAARDVGKDVSILGDLCGPKIRLGKLAEEPIELKNGEKVVLTTDPEPKAGKIPVAFKILHQLVQPGEVMLLDDGKIEARVTDVRDQDIHIEVVIGGEIKSQKGINLPHSQLALSPLTRKDRSDVEFAVENLDLDMFALSFVQRGTDIEMLRGLLAEMDHVKPIIAKIERRQALKDMTQILNQADGVMVARGDLGVEVPYEHVPGIQKNIIREANAMAKPVITATEMLESMITEWRPTRAEATDVSNAILDGSDAVMLSGETAVGHSPAHVVAVMERIARVTEQNMGEGPRSSLPDPTSNDEPRAVCAAATSIAADLSADGLVCLTMSGTTARRLNKYRPRAPIYAFSPRHDTARSLNLSWGTVPIHMPDLVPADLKGYNIENSFTAALGHLKDEGLLRSGSRVVCVAGLPMHTRGQTNLINVRRVP